MKEVEIKEERKQKKKIEMLVTENAEGGKRGGRMKKVEIPGDQPELSDYKTLYLWK